MKAIALAIWITLNDPALISHFPDTAQIERLKEIGAEFDVDDSTGNVTKISISTNKLTDEVLEIVAMISSIEYLVLESSNISDAGLKHIGGLNNLRSLVVRNCTRVQGKELIAIRGKLESLVLKGCPIVDNSLESIIGNRNLVALDLSGTSITDKGIGHLVKIASLQHLNLSRTAISNVSIERIASLPNLKTLRVKGTKVTNSSLSHLARLTALSWLDISENEISDASVPNIVAMRSLIVLDTRNTKISKDGLDVIQKNIKNITIVK